MTEHIHVFTGTSILVNRLYGLLEAEGIGAVIKDETESGRLAGFGAPMNAVSLFILNSDIDKAKAIIESFEAEINA